MMDATIRGRDGVIHHAPKMESDAARMARGPQGRKAAGWAAFVFVLCLAAIVGALATGTPAYPFLPLCLLGAAVLLLFVWTAVLRFRLLTVESMIRDVAGAHNATTDALQQIINAAERERQAGKIAGGFSKVGVAERTAMQHRGDKSAAGRFPKGGKP